MSNFFFLLSSCVWRLYHVTTRRPAGGTLDSFKEEKYIQGKNLENYYDFSKVK